MRTTFAVLAAASALSLSAALAQQATTSTTPAPSAPQASTTMPPAAGNVVAMQKPDQWLMSQFKGMEVIGSDDARIGSVDDILFEKTGSIAAVVVGVGGFLGIGAKDVALTLASFQVVPGSNGALDKLRLAMTKDQLKAAAEFRPIEAPKPVAASRPTMSPTSSSTAPATPMAPKTQ